MIRFETPSQAVRRYRDLLWSEVPFDFRTLTFAYMMGSILSVPVGALMLPYRPFTPPEWTAPIIIVSFYGSLLALPFWSALVLKRQPLLRKIGMRFSVMCYGTLILAAWLFPG